VASKLGQLYLSGETNPKNYAYLADQVAIYVDKVPQRYGTQGHCIKKKGWLADPIEDKQNLDKRRTSVGLMPFAQYKKLFGQSCPK